MDDALLRFVDVFLADEERVLSRDGRFAVELFARLLVVLLRALPRVVRVAIESGGRKYACRTRNSFASDRIC